MEVGDEGFAVSCSLAAVDDFIAAAGIKPADAVRASEFRSFGPVIPIFCESCDRTFASMKRRKPPDCRTEFVRKDSTQGLGEPATRR